MHRIEPPHIKTSVKYAVHSTTDSTSYLQNVQAIVIIGIN